MLNLSEKLAAYQLGLGIGYFKLPKVVEWVDLTILQLESSEIPYQLYEVSLSSNKKIDDVISLLNEITRGNHIDIASKVILGLLYKSFAKKELEIHQVITSIYRLAWERNIEDDIFSKINELDAEYEMAMDGYGDMRRVKKEIHEFLERYEMYGELM
ncbi:hypothetical protein [Domibacillus iocasae]|uniref:Uncharacterized protein n=1 Tax=Domibacillus iocasae TaxID=1714016 RepID=A0A1E7DSC3_9BACI|nr:hypothetical protein [Domibacillus iocasae]OES45984.1 hypothetical protein BA724_16585 [Domibacillus iocasae]